LTPLADQKDIRLETRRCQEQHCRGPDNVRRYAEDPSPFLETDEALRRYAPKLPSLDRPSQNIAQKSTQFFCEGTSSKKQREVRTLAALQLML
jgi:hypothetical protein